MKVEVILMKYKVISTENKTHDYLSMDRGKKERNIRVHAGKTT